MQISLELTHGALKPVGHLQTSDCQFCIAFWSQVNHAAEAAGTPEAGATGEVGVTGNDGVTGLPGAVIESPAVPVVVASAAGGGLRIAVVMRLPRPAAAPHERAAGRL